MRSRICSKADFQRGPGAAGGQGGTVLAPQQLQAAGAAASLLVGPVSSVLDLSEQGHLPLGHAQEVGLLFRPPPWPPGRPCRGSADRRRETPWARGPWPEPGPSAPALDELGGHLDQKMMTTSPTTIWISSDEAETLWAPVEAGVGGGGVVGGASARARRTRWLGHRRQDSLGSSVPVSMAVIRTPSSSSTTTTSPWASSVLLTKMSTGAPTWRSSSTTLPGAEAQQILHEQAGAAQLDGDGQLDVAESLERSHGDAAGVGLGWSGPGAASSSRSLDRLLGDDAGSGVLVVHFSSVCLGVVSAVHDSMTMQAMALPRLVGTTSQ